MGYMYATQCISRFDRRWEDIHYKFTSAIAILFGDCANTPYIISVPRRNFPIFIVTLTDKNVTNILSGNNRSRSLSNKQKPKKRCR